MAQYTFNVTYTVTIPEIDETITSDPTWVKNPDNFIHFKLSVNNDENEIYNLTVKPWSEAGWHNERSEQYAEDPSLAQLQNVINEDFVRSGLAHPQHMLTEVIHARIAQDISQ